MRDAQRYPRAVDDTQPVPKVTPDHFVTIKNAVIGGVMSILTAAAGIVGSHWGGATKGDVQSVKQDLADRALDDATAHSAIWVQLNAIQAKQNTVDPSPPARAAKKTKKKPASEPPGGASE